jgi:membrane-bound ClpP family serine protease
VVAAYYSVVLALGVSGITMLITPILGNIVATNFHPLSLISLGIALMALSGLGVILGIQVARGFAWVIKGVINLHGEWITGRKVFVNAKNNAEEVSI